MGEFGWAADGDPGLEFLGRALMAGPDDEEEVLRVGGEGEVAFDHDLAVVLRGLPEFADRSIGDPVG